MTGNDAPQCLGRVAARVLRLLLVLSLGLFLGAVLSQQAWTPAAATAAVHARTTAPSSVPSCAVTSGSDWSSRMNRTEALSLPHATIGHAGVAAEGAGEASTSVGRTVADAREWLGPGGRAITNDAGDKIFLSENGLRRIRVDINRPYPHEFGHAHLEEFIDGKWVRSGPIYPYDVPGR